MISIAFYRLVAFLGIIGVISLMTALGRAVDHAIVGSFILEDGFRAWTARYVSEYVANTIMPQIYDILMFSAWGLAYNFLVLFVIPLAMLRASEDTLAELA